MATNSLPASVETASGICYHIFMRRTMDDLQDLTEIQRTVLTHLEQDALFTATFYFTGGTLLKALGIVPRESNDLDFFTFPGTNERAYLRCLAATKDLLHKLSGGEVLVTERGFLLPQENMRIECVYDAVHAIGTFTAFGNLQTSSLQDLAANKSAAFCVRDELRDYVDLALLTDQKRWQLADLAAIAEEKFGLRTITEEKLLAEFLRKKELFHPCPAEIFLRNHKENAAKTDQQIENLLQQTTL